MKVIKYVESKKSQYANLIKKIPLDGELIVSIPADEFTDEHSNLHDAAKSIGLLISIKPLDELDTYQIKVISSAITVEISKKIEKLLTADEMTKAIIINRCRPRARSDIENAIDALVKSGSIEEVKIKHSGNGNQISKYRLIKN